jgi:hypothetical protein
MSSTTLNVLVKLLKPPQFMPRRGDRAGTKPSWSRTLQSRPQSKPLPCHETAAWSSSKQLSVMLTFIQTFVIIRIFLESNMATLVDLQPVTAMVFWLLVSLTRQIRIVLPRYPGFAHKGLGEVTT